MRLIELVRILWLGLAAYGVLGLFFAVAFHLRGLQAVDTGARGTGVGFRLLITPGVVALWPLLTARWRHLTQGRLFLGGPEAPVSPRRLRATHALAWKTLAVILPLAIAAVLRWRSEEASPSQLPAPNALQEPSRKIGRAPSSSGGGAKSLQRGDALALGAW